MSGVSSMMTSTPVASSKARMFRPSRPMMRPFISSFGSATADTVVSAVCSAAMRCTARATIFFASRSALRRAVSRISRMRLAASACACSSIRRISSAFASCGGQPGELPPGGASRRPSACRSRSCWSVTTFSRRPSSLARRAELAVALVDRLALPVELRLALLQAALLALDLLAPAAHLGLLRLAELDAAPPCRRRRRSCAVASASRSASARMRRRSPRPCPAPPAAARSSSARPSTRPGRAPRCPSRTRTRPTAAPTATKHAQQGEDRFLSHVGSMLQHGAAAVHRSVIARGAALRGRRTLARPVPPDRARAVTRRG